MKIFFELAADVTATERTKLFGSLRGRGATRVRRLFPSAPEPDRSRVFVADVPAPADGKVILRSLKRRRDVEYADVGAQRQPSRPRRPR